jgi:hypothetical protein
MAEGAVGPGIGSRNSTGGSRDAWLREALSEPGPGYLLGCGVAGDLGVHADVVERAGQDLTAMVATLLQPAEAWEYSCRGRRRRRR